MMFVMLFILLQDEREISTVFKSNVKNGGFWICSIFPTAKILKVLCCFLICYVVLRHHAAKSYSKHGSSIVQQNARKSVIVQTVVV